MLSCRGNKKTKNTAIAKYSSHLKKNRKDLLATPKTETTFFTLSINYCHYLREELKTQIKFTAFNFFINGSSFFDNPTLATIKIPEVGFAIWRRYNK